MLQNGALNQQKLSGIQKQFTIFPGLCWTLRGFIYPVRGHGRRRSEFLRRPDQDVHRSRQSQPVLHGPGPHRPLTGERVEELFP